MNKTSLQYALFAWVALLAADPAWAASKWNPKLVASASATGVKPSAFGIDLAASVLTTPLDFRQVLIGPKVGMLVASGSGVTRLDLNVGVESVAWLVNALGLGLAVQAVVPSTATGTDPTVHLRVEPSASIRFHRVADVGALAVRAGLPYDSHYRWGWQLGISLQFMGVPGVY